MAVGLLVVLVGTLTIGPFISDRMLQSVDTTKYQVVYLANGQVYFGKLQNTRGDYLVIRGAYTAQDVKSTTAENTTNQTTLLKVSEQVYGPDDSIAIKSSQVLFWQNLRDDSRVVQAIKDKR